MGIIPGPKKLQDFDSFIWPLMQELLQLELGIKAYNALSDALFLLHMYLIVNIGDIPVISLLTHMKGHNTPSPCRMCKIIGIRGPHKTYYVPLDHRKCRDPSTPACYDPSELPIHTHDNFINEACHVQLSPKTSIAEEHAKEYRINGIPVLSALSSLRFPLSFPYDCMHLWWANLLPNLIALWTGSFKNMSLMGEDFALEPAVWKEVCAASVCAGDTIPTSFGCHVPNLEKHRRELMAESMMVWTVFIAPIVLHGRFKKEKYYNHFIDLVHLLNLCLKYELPRVEVAEIEEGFARWVKQYEQ